MIREQTYTEINRAVFERNVDVYKEAEYWREDEESLVNRYFTKKGMTVLVGGVGRGRTVGPLLDKGFPVFGVDISAGMIDAARGRFGDRATFAVMDIQKTSFESDRFEYILLPFHTICYTDDPWKTLQEMKRILKPGGVLIVSAANHLFLKDIVRGEVFKGKRRAMHVITGKGRELSQRHFTIFEVRHFRRLFPQVSVFGRLSLQSHPAYSFAERVMRAMPLFDKSLYFVCGK